MVLPLSMLSTLQGRQNINSSIFVAPVLHSLDQIAVKIHQYLVPSFLVQIQFYLKFKLNKHTNVKETFSSRNVNVNEEKRNHGKYYNIYMNTSKYTCTLYLY